MPFPLAYASGLCCQRLERLPCPCMGCYPNPRIMDQHEATTVGTPPLTPERVFRDYAPRVYSLARRMLNSDADAEDVTQDVLLQVVRKLGTFRGESAFPTWLHRVTVNAALAYRQKRAHREEHRVYDPLENFLEDHHHAGPVRRWSTTPEDAALDHETHELIERAIGELPQVYRDVFVLADVEG